MRFSLIAFIGFCFLYLLGCQGDIIGDKKDNIPPETFTVADTIIRVGDDRFVSQVLVQWWGTDLDGVISAYEYSVDGAKTWKKTLKQDSVFFVQLPEGEDTFDFDFRVRAIDNYNLVDPTPAQLFYPVKNSAPSVQFSYQEGNGANPSRNPLKTFPIVQFKWEGFDSDGNDNISYYEFVINDTNAKPIVIPATYSSLVLEAENMDQDQSACKLYLGSVNTLQDDLVEGLQLNSANKFYIRAIDKVGATSNFTASRSVYIKKIQSKVLLVNAYSSSIENREDFFINNLSSIGVVDMDTIRINEVVDGNYTQLASDNLLQAKIFSKFETLIFFGSDAPYTLTFAQRTTNEFIANGGKMFFSVYFNTTIDDQSQYLEFTPIDSLVEAESGTFFVNKNAAIKPLVGGWPELSSNTIITSARPFYEGFNASPLYDAELSNVGGENWKGKSTVMAKRVNSVGETDFIISSIELFRLNGNTNIQALFEKIFKDEFKL